MYVLTDRMAEHAPVEVVVIGPFSTSEEAAALRDSRYSDRADDGWPRWAVTRMIEPVA